MSSIVWDEISGRISCVIKINVCLRADTNPFLAALYGRHPVRLAVRLTVDFRPAEASKAAVRYVRSTCAPCKGVAFQWVQVPPGQTLQPEATGAVMEVTKWLKPSV